MVTDELLRRAIFDPDVRERRMLGYRAGLRIDAGDLQRALGQLMPQQPPSHDEIVAAIRRHGGDFVTYPPKRLVGGLLRKLSGGAIAIGRPEYWLDMHAWQRLRQHRSARCDAGR